MSKYIIEENGVCRDLWRMLQLNVDVSGSHVYVSSTAKIAKDMQNTPAAGVKGWLARLETLVQGRFSDTVVFHILGLVRKIIEAEHSGEAFFYLNFFCDWAMHTKVDRKGARRVLGHFDERCPAILDSKVGAASAWRYYVLFAFHLQLQQFLGQHGLSEMSQQSWLEFLAEYLVLISGCPATNSGKLGLRRVAEIVVDRSNSSRTSFNWKIVLNDGSEKRFLLRSIRFFGRARRTAVSRGSGKVQ